MIIAVDGNVYAGKTTLAKYLARENGMNLIKEYCEYIESIPLAFEFDSMEKNEQMRYIRIERDRKKEVAVGNNILDRSFVSMSAHVYASYKCGLNDIRRFYLEELRSALNADQVIIPDYYILVICDHNVSKERMFLNNFKNTPSVFIDMDYYNYVNEYNHRWQEAFSGLVLSGTDAKNRLNTYFLNRDLKDTGIIFSKNEEILMKS
jgi:deoxyadenosine/deoxycytidine kinase